MNASDQRPIKVTLAENVIALRTALGLSQEELAHRANLHRTYVSAVERRKRKVSIEVVAKLAAGLNVEAWRLLKPD